MFLSLHHTRQPFLSQCFRSIGEIEYRRAGQLSCVDKTFPSFLQETFFFEETFTSLKVLKWLFIQWHCLTVVCRFIAAVCGSFTGSTHLVALGRCVLFGRTWTALLFFPKLLPSKSPNLNSRRPTAAKLLVIFFRDDSGTSGWVIFCQE